MKKFELLIKNGTIIDGSGEPKYKTDIGISKGKIIEIGNLEKSGANKTIDAKGYFVSPGFIDSHSHSDWTILIHPTGDSKVLQGITSDISGLCGYSAAPIRREEWYKLLYVRMTVGWSMHYSAAAYNDAPLSYGRQVAVDWSSMGEYLGRIEETGIGINYGMLFGHGAIRYWTMGLEARQSTPEELEVMKKITEKAMEEGALGMSVALTGCPGCWASTSELIELCKIVAKYNGVYMPHQRRGSAKGGLGLGSMERPVKETVEIAKQSGVRSCCSHTAIDSATLKVLEDARAKGIDITFDMFPYPGSIASNLVYMLPHWLGRYRDQGFDFIIKQLKDPEVRERFKTIDYSNWIATTRSIPGTVVFEPQRNISDPPWEHMQVQKVWTRKNKKYVGKTFMEIAKMRGVDPWTAWFDMLCEEEGYVRWLDFLGSESLEDMYSAKFEECIKVPYCCIESDSPISSPRGVTITSVDPRAYGTFPLVFSEYVRKRKIISWETAVKQMTSNPARAIGLKNRGLLKEGYFADICIFNPETITHKANWKNALELSQGINHDIYPEGVAYTIVNGVIVNDNGKLTGALPGTVLRNTI